MQLQFSGGREQRRASRGESQPPRRRCLPCCCQRGGMGGWRGGPTPWGSSSSARRGRSGESLRRRRGVVGSVRGLAEGARGGATGRALSLISISPISLILLLHTDTQLSGSHARPRSIRDCQRFKCRPKSEDERPSISVRMLE